MAFELAKKIIDEISGEVFKARHNVRMLQVGENGDAFLNKDLIDILRYVRSRLPGIEVLLFTNFHGFTPDKAEIILGERLIQGFRCNIDSSSKQGYYLAKKMDLDVVSGNLRSFFEIRSRLNSEAPIHIGVLNPGRYIREVMRYFGSCPAKLKSGLRDAAKDDFHEVKKQWKRYLGPQDTISRQSIFFWAEREKAATLKLDYAKFSCPNLEAVKSQAYIAPDGTWYACCLDSDNELALGNVSGSGIEAIYESKQRADLIKMLENKEFARIKGPCRTVDCCQKIFYESHLRSFLKKILMRERRGGAI